MGEEFGSLMEFGRLIGKIQHAVTGGTAYSTAPRIPPGLGHGNTKLLYFLLYEMFRMAG